jgi:Leucine-rich repeat (LRR) protein
MRYTNIITLLTLLVLVSGVSKGQDDRLVNLLSLEELSRQKLYTDIKSLPNELDSVFRLDLSKQELWTLPEIVSKMTNLQELNLSMNSLSKLSEIGNLRQLQVLNIGMNKFTTFPIEITSYTNLKVLDLWWNDIQTLPDEFFNNNTQLEELNMTSMFEFDFRTNLSKIHSFKRLKRLNLGNNQIPELTIQFDRLENLEVFAYIGQDTIDLSKLCVELAKCKKLRTLHISANNIKELPNEIALLENLEELNLYRNEIKTLPDEIIEMKRLKEINLINNPISKRKIKRIQNRMPLTKIIF